MTVNITAGKELNKLLAAKHPEEHFVPFNEAMIHGCRPEPLFSEDFIRERALHHGVSENSYRSNMQEFLEFLARIRDYSTVVLWFGSEDFCTANLRTVQETLKQFAFHGSVTVHIVNEYTLEEIRSECYAL